MERGFFCQKGGGVGRGVKEKDLNDSTGPTASESGPDVSFASAGNAPGKSSYANVTSKPSGKKLNIRTLFTPGGNGIDVVVLVESIRAISGRFANTAYGFFLGKRVAYPVVANSVRNTWGKYGLVRSMFSSSTRLFSFQFRSIDGLDAMLENGLWFIRNNSLILKKWHPDENLLKEDVSTISVWVKLHGVPITAFSDDGLSAIATKLGTPLMLDFHTTDMCMQSWGRSSYARVMIELRAVVELKDNIIVAMPRIKGEGYYTCNIRVEYEWKPLRCACCKVFGHVHEECPKNTGAGVTKNLKKISQTPKAIPVGQKMGFKPK
ncbi:putative reverse transcriptase domain-containing protein [Tanacetum coccineum]